MIPAYLLLLLPPDEAGLVFAPPAVVTYDQRCHRKTVSRFPRQSIGNLPPMTVSKQPTQDVVCCE